MCSWLPYGTGICHFAFRFFVASFFCFCPLLFYIFFNLISIHKMEWSTIPVCPSLVDSFNRGSVEFERTNAAKIFFVSVGMYVFYVCVKIGFVD